MDFTMASTRLQVQWAEASITLLTSLTLVGLLPGPFSELKALLLMASCNVCFHEAFLKHKACEGRLPSGLGQGCFLVPWVLSAWSADRATTWWNEGLFLSSVCTGMLVCFVSLLRSSRTDVANRQSGIGACIMGYMVALLMCCVLLRRLDLALQTKEEGRVLLKSFSWMATTVVLITLETQHLSECFSLGEMLVCSQILSTLFLFVLSANPYVSLQGTKLDDTRQVVYLMACMIITMLGFSVFTCLSVRQWSVDRLHRMKGVTFRKRTTRVFSILVHLLSVGSSFCLFSLRSASIQILKFSLETALRRWLIVYWCTVLAFGIWSAQWLKGFTQNIIMRKWFHFIAIALFLPANFLDPVFLQLALYTALILFFLVEGIRLCCIPILSLAIDRFLSAFTDHRDNGPIIFSHFSLLIGLALPLWIAPVVEEDAQTTQVLGLSGIVGLGIGDSFAAIVGTWYGRTHCVKGIDKSVEGAIAFFITTMLGWMVLAAFLRMSIAHLVLPTIAAAVFEASSSQNDNLFLPLYYITMIKLF